MSDNPLAGARDGTERTGSLALILVFAALLAGAAAAFALLPGGPAANFATALLAFFAVAGVFAVFSSPPDFFNLRAKPRMTISRNGFSTAIRRR